MSSNQTEQQARISGAAPAEYEAAIQAWRGASVVVARSNLTEAARKSPAFGAVYLYSLILYDETDDLARQYYRLANERRASLTASERSILEAFAPAMDVPSHLAETESQLTKVLSATSQPEAIGLYALALVRFRLEKIDEAESAVTTLLTINPQLPIAWLERAMIAIARDDVAAARDAFHRCLLYSPFATSCLASLAYLEANEGNCQVTVELLKKSLAHSSPPPEAFSDLARALYGRGATIESIRTTIQQGAARIEEDDARKAYELRYEFSLAILQGRFDTARDAAARWNDVTASSLDEDAHIEPFRAQIYTALETGDSKAAASVAKNFLAAREAWTPSSYEDSAIIALRTLYLVGDITHEAFEGARERWINEQHSGPHLYRKNGTEWVEAFASSVTSRPEALEALEALPRYEPLPDRYSRDLLSDEPIGYTYLAAGKLDDAILYLRRGARACTALDQPIAYVWAHLHLAEALDAAGDRDGACSAYKTVEAYWGGDARSVSGRRSRLALRKLSCQ